MRKGGTSNVFGDALPESSLPESSRTQSVAGGIIGHRICFPTLFSTLIIPLLFVTIVTALTNC